MCECISEWNQHLMVKNQMMFTYDKRQEDVENHSNSVDSTGEYKATHLNNTKCCYRVSRRK